MRRGPLSLALALCLLAHAGSTALAATPAARTPVEAVRVLAERPHDPAAFTEGLILRGGALYESTGLYGRSDVRRVDPATGRVLARTALPAELFGEGLDLCRGADGRDRLLQLTWREGRILAYSPATLRPLGQARLSGEGWGLACRGREAWMSNGTSRLRALDAATLAETGRGVVVRDGATPVTRLNELEWVNGWLLANVWQEDRVAVIRPDTGAVVLWLDLSALRKRLGPGAEVANGVAFDPDAALPGGDGRGALLLTGKRWDKLFVAALPAMLRRPPQPAGHGRARRVPGASRKAHPNGPS